MPYRTGGRSTPSLSFRQALHINANLVAKRRTRHLRSQRAQMLEGRPIAGEAYANANIVVDEPPVHHRLPPGGITRPQNPDRELQSLTTPYPH
jgi:hypothetical protein